MTKDFDSPAPSSPPDACLLCSPDLTALFDGEADDAATRRACAHLEGCPACAAAYRDWAQSRSLLRAVAPAALPPTLPERLLITCRLQGLSQARRVMRDLPLPQALPVAASFDAPVDALLLPEHAFAARRARSWASVAVLAVPAAVAGLMLLLSRAPQQTRPAASVPDGLSAAAMKRAPSPVMPRLMAQLPPQIAAARRAALDVPLRSQNAAPIAVTRRNSSSRQELMSAVSVHSASRSTTQRLKRTTRTTLVPQVMLTGFEVAVRPRALRAVSLWARAALRRHVKRVRAQTGAALPADSRLVVPAAKPLLAKERTTKPAHRPEVRPIPRLAMAEKHSSEAAAADDETMFGGVGDDRPEELSRVVDNYRAALIADTDSQS